MTDFTFPPEKRLSRLTLGRVEQLNALFAEIATASATKVEFTLGNLDLNGGRAVNAGDGVNPTDLVTKQQLDATAFAPALPGQAGNAGRFISTDGTNASWVPAPVRYDIAQIRSDAERAQARSNIAAAGSVETATALGLKADAAVVNSALANKADASAVDSALASKADKANPFVDVASASTVDLGAASSLAFNITGTTTITSFGTSAPDGTEYLLKFAGALTVTNGGNLVTGTGANITTFAGMLMRVVKDATNVWRVIEFTRRINVSGGGANRQVANLAAYTADRTITWPDGPVTIPAGTLEKAWTELAPVATTSGGAIDWPSIPAGVSEVELLLDLVSVTSTQFMLVQIGTGGVLATTGYKSGAAIAGASGVRTTDTTGFPLYTDTANYEWYGVIRLVRRAGTNRWLCTSFINNWVTNGVSSVGGGVITLSGALDILRLTRASGTQTFDGGEAILRYR